MLDIDVFGVRVTVPPLLTIINRLFQVTYLITTLTCPQTLDCILFGKKKNLQFLFFGDLSLSQSSSSSSSLSLFLQKKQQREEAHRRKTRRKFEIKTYRYIYCRDGSFGGERRRYRVQRSRRESTESEEKTRGSKCDDWGWDTTI